MVKARVMMRLDQRKIMPLQRLQERCLHELQQLSLLDRLLQVWQRLLERSNLTPQLAEPHLNNHRRNCRTVKSRYLSRLREIFSVLMRAGKPCSAVGELRGLVLVHK